MTRKDRILAEAALRIAVVQNYERELTELENEPNDDVIFSARHEKRMKRLFVQRRAMRTVRRIGAAARRASVSAALFVLVLTGAFMLNGEVRAAIGGAIVDWYDTFTSFNYTEQPEPPQNAEWRLGYVPDGYALSSVNYAAGATDAVYENSAGDVILFSAYPLGSNVVGVDNERSDVSSRMIDDTIYHIFTSEPSIVIWSENGYDFLITASITEDELVKTAQFCQISK